MHRPSDSRLLSNVLSHEKDYAKSLKTVVSTSHALAAYAAACAPPLSTSLLQVSAAVGGADGALARYAEAVDECSAHLVRIRKLEDEVGTVVRDREILVTRLIKASKNVKAVSGSGTTSGMSSPSSVHVAASSKLGAAQAELQACEATLAQKERALERGRVEALRAGLGVRCRALMECGWVWAQVGKSALEALHEDYGRTSETQRELPAPPQAPETYYIPPAHAISDSHSVFPRRMTEDRAPSVGGSSMEEAEMEVRAVDNPRYAVRTPERSPRKAGLLGRRGSNASASGSLLGSLRGLFGGGSAGPSPVFYEERKKTGGKLKKTRTRSSSVPPRGTEIERRHLAAVSESFTISVVGSSAGRSRRGREAAKRKPPRSALRNSQTPSPMPGDASSDSADDVFFDALEPPEVPRRKSVRVSLPARDVWEDSSEEDAEYATARTLLSRLHQ